MSAWKQRESRLSPASSLPAAEDSCFVSGRRFSDGVHFSKSQPRLGECKESRNVDYAPDNRRNRCPVFHLGVRTRATGSAGESEGASELGSDSDGARHGRAETRMPSREQYKKSVWVLKAPEAELTDATGKQNRASLRGTGTEAHRWSRGAPTPRTTISTRRLSSADSESSHITSRRRVETAPNKKDCGILRHEAMTTWQREERHPDPLPCRVRRKTCP